MAAWLLQTNTPYSQLESDLGELASVIPSLETPSTSTTAPPTSTVASPTSSTVPDGTDDDEPPPWVYTVSNVCESMTNSVAVAQSIPLPPIAAVSTDWSNVLSAFATIQSACNQATAGTDPGFAQDWPSLSANASALETTLSGDLNRVGYCIPTPTCPFPFTFPP
jgi:hypothetical protein